MEEFIFFIMFVVFVSTLGGLVLWKIFDLVRNSIKKNKEKYQDDKFDRLAKAFIEHRKKTDRRLQNIEAILTGEESAHTQDKFGKPEKKIGIKQRSGQRTAYNTNSMEVS